MPEGAPSVEAVVQSNVNGNMPGASWPDRRTIARRLMKAKWVPLTLVGTLVAIAALNSAG